MSSRRGKRTRKQAAEDEAKAAHAGADADADAPADALASQPSSAGAGGADAIDAVVGPGKRQRSRGAPPSDDGDFNFCRLERWLPPLPYPLNEKHAAMAKGFQAAHDAATEALQGLVEPREMADQAHYVARTAMATAAVVATDVLEAIALHAFLDAFLNNTDVTTKDHLGKLAAIYCKGAEWNVAEMRALAQRFSVSDDAKAEQ